VMYLTKLSHFLLALIKRKPEDIGQPKANLYIKMSELSFETAGETKHLFLFGQHLSFAEGKRIAEEFAIQHLVGEYHVTEKGYLQSGFLANLPTIKASLVFENSIYQQLLNLYEQFMEKSKRNLELAHTVPELNLPTSPYGLPEDSILWDKSNKLFYLQWCRKLFLHAKELEKSSIKASALNRELWRQECGDMGTWHI